MSRITDNPFPHAPRRVFPRTFLHEVEISVSFEKPLINDSAYQERQKKFTGEVFGAPVPDENVCKFPLVANSEEATTIFVFDENSVRYIIREGRYYDFTHSLLPVLEIIERYLQEVAQRTLLTEVRIGKSNRWELSEDQPEGKDEFNRYLSQIFKPEYAEPLKLADEDQTSSLAKRNAVVGEDAVFAVRFQASPATTKVDSLVSMLSGVQVKNVAVKALKEVVEEANNLLFDFFVDAVREEIIQFMSVEEDDDE